MYAISKLKLYSNTFHFAWQPVSPHLYEASIFDSYVHISSEFLLVGRVKWSNYSETSK